MCAIFFFAIGIGIIYPLCPRRVFIKNIEINIIITIGSPSPSELFDIPDPAIAYVYHTNIIYVYIKWQTLFIIYYILWHNYRYTINNIIRLDWYLLYRYRNGLGLGILHTHTRASRGGRFVYIRNYGGDWKTKCLPTLKKCLFPLYRCT